MALRLPILRLRFSLALLFVFATLCSLLAWRAHRHLEHYRRLDRGIAELRKLEFQLSTKPADVAGFWHKLPGIDPKIFQEVNSLTFPSHAKSRSEVFGLIAEMTELETLGLQGAAFTDDDVLFLQNLHTLKSLRIISSPQLTDATARLIGTRRTLQSVDLQGCEISNAGSAAIASLPHLEQLCLSGDRMDDAGLVCLAQIPNLKYLWLGGNFSDEGLETLAGCRELQELGLLARGATDRTLRTLRKLPKLETLVLGEGVYTDDAILEMKLWGQLKIFQFNGNACVASTLEKYNTLRYQHQIDISNRSRINRNRFFQLGGFAEGADAVVDDQWTGEDWDLVVVPGNNVTINSPRVSDRGIARLTRIDRSLDALTIRSANITPGVTEYLSRAYIRWLSLSGEKIDDSWLPALEQLKNVKRLELVNTRISPEGLEKLKASGVAAIMRSIKHRDETEHTGCQGAAAQAPGTRPPQP